MVVDQGLSENIHGFSFLIFLYYNFITHISEGKQTAEEYFEVADKSSRGEQSNVDMPCLQ